MPKQILPQNRKYKKDEIPIDEDSIFKKLLPILEAKAHKLANKTNYQIPFEEALSDFTFASLEAIRNPRTLPETKTKSRGTTPFGCALRSVELRELELLKELGDERFFREQYRRKHAGEVVFTEGENPKIEYVNEESDVEIEVIEKQEEKSEIDVFEEFVKKNKRYYKLNEKTALENLRKLLSNEKKWKKEHREYLNKVKKKVEERGVELKKELGSLTKFVEEKICEDEYIEDIIDLALQKGLSSSSESVYTTANETYKKLGRKNKSKKVEKMQRIEEIVRNGIVKDKKVAEIREELAKEGYIFRFVDLAERVRKMKIKMGLKK